jgi:glycosyltransferase involved in cell wall biosynthesis
MRLLHVTETAKGGVGTYLNEIVPLQTAALGRGAVRVICPAEHRSQMPDIDTFQVDCFARPKRSIPSLFALARFIPRIAASFQPDIIHAHASFAGLLVRAIYGWRQRRPLLIYCPHGWAFQHRGTAAAERLLAPLCDHIIAISDHEAAEALRVRINTDRLSVVHNAIARHGPPPAPTEWHDKRRKILFIGRLDRQKGLDILAASVRGLENTVVLRVAGEAVRGPACLPHSSNIEYLGWLTPAQIAGQLEQADLLAMPSRWEGFGLTALEAMRAGKPVIASAVGGLPEVVADGISGRLVPPEDAVALRTALLADDDTSLQQMGIAGRDIFHRRFTSDRLHEEILGLYNQLLSTNGVMNGSVSPYP